MTAQTPVGVIGGTGFYQLLDDAEPLAATATPFGTPSGPLTVGTLAGRRVAFLPRHGPQHLFPPHLVPTRANLWALREQQVRQVFSLSAVGSLNPDLGVGSLVVPDQILDRTSGREHTYYDAADGVHHAPFADPYCPVLRRAAAAGGPTRADGVLAVINGPRFSTRAESADLRRSGADLIGMTAMPEAGLARELGLCYATLALVTDLDAGVEAGTGVSHEEVLAAFARNLPLLRDLLVAAILALPAEPDCSCAGEDPAALPGRHHAAGSDAETPPDQEK